MCKLLINIYIIFYFSEKKEVKGKASQIVRYAILGCGKHARQSHAVHGENIGELELIGLFDSNPNQMLLVESAIERNTTVRYAGLISRYRPEGGRCAVPRPGAELDRKFFYKHA